MPTPSDPVPTVALPAEQLDQALQLFQRVVDSDFLNQRQPSPPQTVFTTWATVWLLLYQRLHQNASLTTVVNAFAKIVNAFSTSKRAREQTLSLNTGGFSRARSRLEVDVANAASDEVFRSLLPSPASSLVPGRTIMIVDGTTLSLSPIPALRKEWPAPRNQHGRSASPIMLALVAHELETGLSLRPETGPCGGDNAVSEVTLAIQMLPRMPEKSLILADRFFGIFGFIHAVQQAGHDAIARLTRQRFHALLRQAKPLQTGVWKLDWKPSKKDRQTFTTLPPEAQVQVYLYELKVTPIQTIWIASTLKLEPRQVEAIYRRRYEVELDIRQWKKQMEMENLRGQSVDMVLKELAIGSIAYNLVVQVRQMAAQQAGIPAKRLSFTGVWSLVKTWLLESWSPRTVEQWVVDFERVLKHAAKHKLPNRPGRSYPRQVYAQRGSHFPTRGCPNDDLPTK